MKKLNYKNVLNHKSLTKDKGITLIALIITIIIVLILASVSVAIFSNSNIINKSKFAGENYQNKINQEEKAMQNYASTMNEYSIADAGRDETITINKNDYIELEKKVETLEKNFSELNNKVNNNLSSKIGNLLYSGYFNNGTIEVENLKNYSCIIAICDYGWIIPLYKNDDGYLYGIGGRNSTNTNSEQPVIEYLTLQYSGDNITYIQGGFDYKGSYDETNLAITKIYGIF